MVAAELIIHIALEYVRTRFMVLLRENIRSSFVQTKKHLYETN